MVRTRLAGVHVRRMNLGRPPPRSRGNHATSLRAVGQPNANAAAANSTRCSAASGATTDGRRCFAGVGKTIAVEPLAIPFARQQC